MKVDALREFDRQFKANNGRIELYNARPHRKYIFVTCATATICFLFAGYHAQAVFLNGTEENSKWTKILWGAFCPVLVAFGVHALRRGRKLISGLTAVRIQGKPQLEIKVRRLLPFLKDRCVVTSMSQVSFKLRRLPAQAPAQIPKTKKDGREVPLLGQMYKEKAAERRQAAKDGKTDQLSGSNALSFFKAPVKKTSVVVQEVVGDARSLIDWDAFTTLSIEGKDKGLKYEWHPRSGMTPELVLLFFICRQTIKPRSSRRWLRWFSS